MTADEHTLSGLHFHIWRPWTNDDGTLWRKRLCISGQELHAHDEHEASAPDLSDLFKEQSPEEQARIGKLLGIDPSAPVVPPHLDL